MKYFTSVKNHSIAIILLTTIFLTTLAPGICVADPVTPQDPTCSLTQRPDATQPSTTPNPETLETGLLPDPEREAFEQLMGEVKKLDTELEIAVEEYNAATMLLTETDTYLGDMQEELDIAEAELEARKNIMNDRLSALYKNGSVNFLEVFLNTKSFSDFLVRVSFLVSISLNDSKLLTELEDARNGVENTKVELENLRVQQLAYQQEMDSKKSFIEEKLTRRQNLLGNTSANMMRLINAEKARRSQEAAQLLARARAELDGIINENNSPFVAAAFKYLGVPYVWGGASQNGLDCSGLVMIVLGEHGISMPHYSRYQALMGLPIEDGILHPGDIVFFGNPIHHVGIYIGGDYFIHAPQTGDVVKVSVLSERTDFATARRFVPMTSAAQIQ